MLITISQMAALILSTGVLVLGLACSKSSGGKDQTICVNRSCAGPVKAAPTQSADAVPTPTPVPMEPKAVMLKLREGCVGCHGTGKDKNSFWAMPNELEFPTQAEITARQSEATSSTAADAAVTSLESYLDDPKNLDRIITRLETDPMTVEVFKAIENNVLGEAESIPKAMRPTMDDETRRRFVALMDQFLVEPKASDTSTEPQATATPAITPLSLNEAKSWCVGCHSPGGKGSKMWNQADSSDEAQWKQFAAKAREAVSSGLMPPGQFIGKEKEEWTSVLAFFQTRMPRVVTDARAKYHGQRLNLGVSLVKGFKCSSVQTGREFLNSLTTTALGRPPTQEEIKNTPQLNESISFANRSALVGKLETEWREEFLKIGVKKFAEKVANAEEVRKSNLISDAQLKEDIAGEFYQHVKASMLQGTSYKNVLLGSTVFATKRTAPFYGPGCESRVSQVAEGEYVECELIAPRSTFFTTLGFLAAKPSTMFTENNNYGRVVRMNEVISGSPMKPNTQGETGFTVKPLPSCLNTEDWRVLKQGSGALAPRGTASVPASGNFCQGCHIRRHMASGAIAFRPFGLLGEVLSFSSISDLYNKSQDAAAVANLKPHERALQDLVVESLSGERWQRHEERNLQSKAVNIDLEFFRRLMNVGTQADQEKGCIVETEGEESAPVVVTQVADLANHLVKDEMAISRGLSRIIPRAIADVASTHTEIIDSVDSAWKTGGGQLFPVFRAYFSSETFACRASQEELQ